MVNKFLYHFKHPAKSCENLNFFSCTTLSLPFLVLSYSVFESLRNSESAEPVFWSEEFFNTKVKTKKSSCWHENEKFLYKYWVLIIIEIRYYLWVTFNKSLKTERKSTKTDTVHCIRLFRYPYFQQQFWVLFLLLLNHENFHFPLQHQTRGEKRQVRDLEIEIVSLLKSRKNFNWARRKVWCKKTYIISSNSFRREVTFLGWINYFRVGGIEVNDCDLSPTLFVL